MLYAPGNGGHGGAALGVVLLRGVPMSDLPYRGATPEGWKRMYRQAARERMRNILEAMQRDYPDGGDYRSLVGLLWGRGHARRSNR